MPNNSTSYSEEGTLAHEISDVLLRIRFNKTLTEGGLPIDVGTKEHNKLKRHKLYAPEMSDEVNKYVEYVTEAYVQACRNTGDKALILIEEKLDFSHLVEEGFGTGDTCIIANETLEIIDLKYGKGVPVSAKDNYQLRLYALGALRKYEMMYDISKVKMTIIQPRLDIVSSEEMSVEDLFAWGEEVVKPAAALAYKGEGEQKAGDHCRWCKVKAMCRAQKEMNLQMAKFEFEDPYLLSEAEIVEVMGQISALTEWANAVADYALNQALGGKPLPGYKLVEGRRVRKWKDEGAVQDVLLERGLDPDSFLVTSLVGIPAVEKLLGKNVFYDVLGEQVLLPPGKPTLVPESDKRPAMGVEQAKIDFAD